ncbi:MAG TPA: outer membrane beta-barrel protein [Burkholderiales bacterium]|nr:outer membrane beta-barrel protein [Burkholderiales bacterium]
MKKIGMLFALLAGALLAAQAQAQASGQWYIGAGGGSVWSDGASPYPDTQDDGVATGYKVYGGAIGENWGMELGYYHFGAYDVNFNNVKVAESSLESVVPAIVYAMDFYTGYVFHAKLGIAFTQYKYTCVSSCGVGVPANLTTKETGLSGMWGLGVGARFTKNFEMRMDWEHFGAVHEAVNTTTFKDAYDMFSVSAQLNF